MQIKYQIKEDKPEAKCSNCINCQYCKMSIQRDEVGKYFDISECKQYKYIAPFDIFTCYDEDFVDAVVKLIEKKKSNLPRNTIETGNY